MGCASIETQTSQDSLKEEYSGKICFPDVILPTFDNEKKLMDKWERIESLERDLSIYEHLIYSGVKSQDSGAGTDFQ